MNNDITTINYYCLQIFDKWGNKVLDQEQYDNSGSLNDLDGSEIGWDGTLNGTTVVSGAYSFLVDVSTCGQNAAFQYWADGNLENQQDISGNPIEVEITCRYFCSNAHYRIAVF